jgi:hypothetical protein
MDAVPRHRLRPCLVRAAVLAILYLVVAYGPIVSSSRISSVKVGMTEAEVLWVMGPFCFRGKPYPDGHYYWVWQRWPIHVAVVEFSADGRVTEAFND